LPMVIEDEDEIPVFDQDSGNGYFMANEPMESGPEQWKVRDWQPAKPNPRRARHPSQNQSLPRSATVEPPEVVVLDVEEKLVYEPLVEADDKPVGSPLEDDEGKFFNYPPPPPSTSRNASITIQQLYLYSQRLFKHLRPCTSPLHLVQGRERNTISPCPPCNYYHLSQMLTLHLYPSSHPSQSHMPTHHYARPHHRRLRNGLRTPSLVVWPSVLPLRELGRKRTEIRSLAPVVCLVTAL